ncbi:MAG: hypothetical protein U0527_12570 [Candidatus Eisenbacteria bacterium]
MKRNAALGTLLVGGLVVCGLLLAACASAPPPVDLSDPETAAAWRLMKRRCQSCHALPDLRALSRARWEESLVKMERKVTLTPEEWDAIRELKPVDSLTAH